MPVRNIYFLLFIIGVSIFVTSKTSLKDQIIRNVVHEVLKRSLDPPSEKDLYCGILTGLADSVNDIPYTAYIPANTQTSYLREIQGQYAGIGIINLIKDDLSGEFYFLPLRNTPASSAGLQVGDRIVAVDQQSVVPMTLPELIDKLRGEENTKVLLTIRPRTSNVEFSRFSSEEVNSDENNVNHQSVKLIEISINRTLIQQDIITGDSYNDEGKWNYTLEKYPNIGYISIEQFVDSTGKQVIDVLNTLEKNNISKLILDFRGNPGGFLGDAITICNELLSAGSPIVETRNRKGTINRYIAQKYPKRRFRVAILIDSESASAAEIVSAALQDAGIGVVIGVRSYGKGTIQGIYELPCKMGVLRMTTASFWRPSGQPIRRPRDFQTDSNWGVVPDLGYEVPVSVPQRYYTQWVRNVRISQPNAQALDGITLEFMTNQISRALTLWKNEPNRRLELAIEFGLNQETPSLTENRLSITQSNKGNNLQNNYESQQLANIAFQPSGLAPYFDPQLDRAIEYLNMLE